MHTLTRKPKQLTLALAALAIGAIVAVVFAAGRTQVRAQDGVDITPDPEPCSDSPARVVSSGHYAIFDVYWDSDDENLVTNPCPPKIIVEAHEELDEDNEPTGNTTYTHTRAASDINIGSAAKAKAQTMPNIPALPQALRTNSLQPLQFLIV